MSSFVVTPRYRKVREVAAHYRRPFTQLPLCGRWRPSRGDVTVELDVNVTCKRCQAALGLQLDLFELTGEQRVRLGLAS